MAEENNGAQSVDEAAIRAKLEKELSAKFESQYRSQFEAERDKILANKEEILGEYKAFKDQYKGVTPESIQAAKAFEEQKAKDEMTALLAEGRIEEATQRLMRSQLEEWNREREQFDERVGTVQKERDTLSEKLAELEQKNLDMTRRSYLKDLVGSDDSFRKEYFGDFVELYGKKVDVDKETNAMYVKDENGKRMIDANGDYLKFDEYYAKQKVNHGLFWSSGAGTGYNGKGGDGQGKRFKDMTPLEKNQLRKEMGDAKYEAFVRDQGRKQ